MLDLRYWFWCDASGRSDYWTAVKQIVLLLCSSTDWIENILQIAAICMHVLYVLIQSRNQSLRCRWSGLQEPHKDEKIGRIFWKCLLIWNYKVIVQTTLLQCYCHWQYSSVCQISPAAETDKEVGTSCHDSSFPHQVHFALLGSHFKFYL